MRFPSVLFLVVFLSVVSFTLGDSEENSSSSEENKDINSKEIENVTLFIRGLMYLAYQEDKLESIQDITNTLLRDTDTSNVTLVGTQNIYNKDGTLKEVRTIELSLANLQRESKNDIFNLDEKEKLKNIKSSMKDMSLIGINVDIAYTELNEEGSTTEEIFYLTNNLLISQNDGITFVNKTIIVDTINQIPPKPKGLISSTLMYDQNSTFLKDKSTVVPELFAVIEHDHENPSLEIIQDTLGSFVNAALESSNPDDIPQNLRGRLEGLYPGVVFTVTSDEPDGSYISKDFSIYLAYDFVEFDSSPKYSVYGYNRSFE